MAAICKARRLTLSCGVLTACSSTGEVLPAKFALALNTAVIA